MIRRTNCAERLQVLILGQDPEIGALVRATLEDLGITGSCSSPDSTAASEILANHHFDGIILDCADPEWSREMLKKLRTGQSNCQSPVIAIVNSVTDVRAVQKSGVDLTICKPISRDTITSQLRRAFDAMQSEHLRYFRYPVSQPVWVGTKTDDLASARLLNVSQDGLALWLKTSRRLEGAVILTFDLPSIEPYRIEARGEIAWCDADGRIGIKIVHMPEEARRRYGEWLDVLHSQLEFRKLIQEVSQSKPPRGNF